MLKVLPIIEQIINYKKFQNLHTFLRKLYRVEGEFPIRVFFYATRTEIYQYSEYIFEINDHFQAVQLQICHVLT